MPTAIQPIPGVPTAQTRTPPSPILGKDDFLRLLTMQLRFQDPMDPVKGTEFAAQLAQFSSVEQLSNINRNILQSIDANYVLTQSISNALATTFVGKEVRASVDTFQLTGEKPVKLGYNLQSAAESVRVNVYDEAGNLVRTIVASGNAGDNTLTWDGTNEQGTVVPPGKYKFAVEAQNATGGSISATLFIVGKVHGVRFRAEGTVFVIEGMEVRLSDILEIMQG